MFQPLADLQLNFASERYEAGRQQGPGTRRWRDGFYAYKRGGYELIRYREWNGRQKRQFKFVYVKTPQELRGFQEDLQYGIRQGGIMAPMILNFRVYCSPGELLLVPRIHEQVSRSLASGTYVVRLLDGPEGDVELIYPVWPKGAERHPQYQNVLTLSAKHDYAPIGFRSYLRGKLISEWELELFKVQEGLWLGREAHGRQTPNQGWPNGLEFHLKVDVLSVKVNSGLKPDFFTFEFPPGTRVYNRITQERYVVGMDQADAGKRLKAMAARAEELAGPPRPLARSRAGWSGTDWLVAASALLLIVAFGGMIVLAVRQKG